MESSVFKETTWNYVTPVDTVRIDLETNKFSKNACAIHAKNQFFNSWKTVRHIPRKICQHAYCPIKTEGDFMNRSIISTKYCPSPITSGGLEMSLLVKFLSPEQKTFQKMKKIVDCLYDYDWSGFNNKESSDEEEAAIVIETFQLKPVSHPAADQSKMVSYTDCSSEEEEEDLHADVNFDEPIDLAIN